MSGVYLDHIELKRESKSFTDCLHAVLTAAHLFDGPKYMLSGLSGLAFKFTVHDCLLSMSVSAYGQWGQEHQPAIDNLGIYTVSDGGRTRHPTFRDYQREAVKTVISSLDRGVAVIYWIPEFGVIHGYDDEDRIFYVQNGYSAQSSVVLYDNFGLNFTPFWYIQLLGEQVKVTRETMVLGALRLAIHDWDTPYKTLPNKDIASGRMAYSFLIRGLEKGDYDLKGAVYILDSFSYSRTEIMLFLQDSQGTWPELDEAINLYRRLVDTISGMNDCIAKIGAEDVRQVVPKRIPELIDMIKEADLLEDKAINLFRQISNREPDLKRSLVPRWGSHSPR